VIPDRRHADTQANNSGSAGAAMRMAFIDLSNLTFVAGQSGSDSLKIGATDGFVFSGWSPLTSLTVNAPVDNPPVVSAVGTSVPATKGSFKLPIGSAPAMPTMTRWLICSKLVIRVEPGRSLQPDVRCRPERPGQPEDRSNRRARLQWLASIG
jgi:hypothetical protein